MFLPMVLFLVYLIQSEGSAILLALTSAVVGFLFIGYLDDRYRIAPVPRLFFASVVVWLVQYLVPDFSLGIINLSYNDLELGLHRSRALATLISVVGATVIINMADGKNGIVLGMSLIWLAALTYLGLLDVLPFLPILVPAVLVGLAFNLRGKLFLGDAGSGTFGALFALIAIYINGTRAANLPSDAIASWFWIPALDALRLIILRVRKGRSPLSGDREHLHHLLYASMPEAVALVTYLSLFAAPIIMSILLPGLSYVWLTLSALSYVAVVLWLRRRLSLSRALSQESSSA